MRAARWAALVCGLAFAALLAARDHEQQRRIDLLAKQIDGLRAELRQYADARPGPPLTGRCSLDSSSLDAIVAAVARASSRPAANPQKDAPNTAAPEEARKVPPARTPEEDAALAQANDLVDVALRRGHIAPGDIHAMRQAFAAADSPESVAELRQRIVVAINNGQLVPDDPRMFLP